MNTENMMDLIELLKVLPKDGERPDSGQLVNQIAIGEFNPVTQK